MTPAAQAAQAEAGRETQPAEVRVWDPLVRIFHWSLVAGFALAWVTGDEGGAVHNGLGYIVLGLVAFRVVWGFVGARHARFSDFLYSPGVVVHFLKASLRGCADRYIGHNPAGGAMIVALLATVAVVSISGIMMTTDAYWGVEWVQSLHSVSVTVCLILVGMHLLGVIFASIEHGENLVRAMINGRKRRQ